MVNFRNTGTNLMKQLHIYITNHTLKEKKNSHKKGPFFNDGEKGAKFEDFRQNNYAFTKAIAKNCEVQNISQKRKRYGKIGAYLCSQYK